jgi:hypothetical protein
MQPVRRQRVNLHENLASLRSGTVNERKDALESMYLILYIVHEGLLTMEPDRLALLFQ